MNKYYKIENGKKIWFEQPLKIDGRQILNATEDMILSDGWIKYITPEPSVDEIKKSKIREIDEYDNSLSVNEFFIGETSVWMDKATRTGIILTLDAASIMNQSTYTFWYGVNSWELPIETARQMLYAVELYASSCYGVTAQHKANVEALTDRMEIRNYDYRTGYPEKIVFNLPAEENNENEDE